MHYVEYIYLAAAVMMGIGWLEVRDFLPLSAQIAFAAGITASLVMFVVRRKKRQKIDQAIQEEMQQIERELED